MIGFIALAGIVVRNSILLVDFIRHLREKGMPLRAALVEAGAVRFKPIFLTAAAAIIGAAFILTDPIFQGLAISLVFGLASSTALTLLVIPAIYVVLRDDERPAGADARRRNRKARMTNDWPELTKALSADIRNLRVGTPDVMKAFSAHGDVRRRVRRARRQDEGTDRSRGQRRGALRRLHRLPRQGRRGARRDARGSYGDARHGDLHGRWTFGDVREPCARGLHAVRRRENAQAQPPERRRRKKTCSQV